MSLTLIIILNHMLSLLINQIHRFTYSQILIVLIYLHMQIMWVRKLILTYFQGFGRVMSKCLSLICILTWDYCVNKSYV